MIRNKFSPVVKKVIDNFGPSRTQQHFMDSCDINKILAKYRKTGVIEHVKRAKAMYGDFSEYVEVAQNLGRWRS